MLGGGGLGATGEGDGLAAGGGGLSAGRVGELLILGDDGGLAAGRVGELLYDGAGPIDGLGAGTRCGGGCFAPMAWTLIIAWPAHSKKWYEDCERNRLYELETTFKVQMMTHIAPRAPKRLFWR